MNKSTNKSLLLLLTINLISITSTIAGPCCSKVAEDEDSKKEHVIITTQQPINYSSNMDNHYIQDDSFVPFEEDKELFAEYRKSHIDAKEIFKELSMDCDKIKSDIEFEQLTLREAENYISQLNNEIADALENLI